MMTKPLIVASRAVSGCLRFPGVAWASRLRPSAPTRLSGASSRCPEGDPGGSEFHVAYGPSWRVAIDRHNECTEATRQSNRCQAQRQWGLGSMNLDRLMAEAEEIRRAADAKLAELVAAIKQQEATEPGGSRPGPEVRRLTAELRAINARLGRVGKRMQDAVGVTEDEL